MKTFIKNKGILTAVAIFILVMFLYNFFLKSDTILTSSTSQASNIGDDLLKIHKELQTVTLNREVFSFPEYLSLIDFSVTVPQQAIGRSNPFDIIGRD